MVSALLHWLPASLLLGFCFTPNVSSYIFRTWHCKSFAHDGYEEHSFLALDLSVRCDDSDAHREIIGVAWVMIVIWPVGMVLGCLGLLLPLRFVFLEEAAPTPLLRATAFLHRDYKPSYFWWEVASLAQRTILTGWLLLIDSDLKFVRLLAALIVTVFFLVALLVVNPYLRLFDYGMAAGCQILFVCIFIMGIVVQPFEDVSSDFAGSLALAQRTFSLTSADDAVVIMIVAAFLMIVLLAATLAANIYIHLMQARLRKKWSVGTMDPPSFKWRPQGLYACFLSHYKMEAASEARYMHDVLRKMLRCPIFLDSSTLSDLRKLVDEGVQKSDVVVLLATEDVLIRPWCLIELVEAARARKPIVVVNVVNRGFSFHKSRQLVIELEQEMAIRNSSGLDLLRKHFGPNLDELKTTIMGVLDANESTVVHFDSHVGDNAMIGVMKDVVERMAAATNRNVRWDGEREGSVRLALSAQKRNSSRKQLSRLCSRTGRGLTSERQSRGESSARSAADADADGVANEESSIFVCCSRPDALNHARVLRSELEISMARGCAIGGARDTHQLIPKSEAFVVMLTKNLLSDPNALLEIWTALSNKLPFIPVNITGGGFDFSTSAQLLDMSRTCVHDAEKPSGTHVTLQDALKQQLPADADLMSVGQILHSSLKSIIAIAWTPVGSPNHMAAVVEDILSRCPKKKRAESDKKWTKSPLWKSMKGREGEPGPAPNTTSSMNV